MGRSPGRPVKTRGPPHGHGEAAHIKPTSHQSRPIKFSDDGLRPSPALKFSDDGPRPGPAHQFFTR